MIDLYTWATPKGWKASVTLEELGLPYTVHPVDLGKGEQNYFRKTYFSEPPKGLFR